MKKYTITSEEYELMCEKLHSLENENNRLKGYIEGLEKQLTIPVVVRQSEQLVCSCGSIKVMTTGGSQCSNNRCSLAN